jgi:hypothetical protein
LPVRLIEELGENLKGKKMQRLTKTFATTDCTTLDDALACMMATIEDGLLTSGFVPGKDYQRKDLFDAAMPLVQNIFNENNLLYTTSWPNAN